MTGNRLLRVLCFVTVLHLAVLSFAFGPRRWEYVLTAYSSAVVVWGLLFLMERRRRPLGWILGIAVVTLIQQSACPVTARELGDAFWPLAQFFGVQFLVGVALKRVFDYSRRHGVALNASG